MRNRKIITGLLSLFMAFSPAGANVFAEEEPDNDQGIIVENMDEELNHGNTQSIQDDEIIYEQDEDTEISDDSSLENGKTEDEILSEQDGEEDVSDDYNPDESPDENDDADTDANDFEGDVIEEEFDVSDLVAQEGSFMQSDDEAGALDNAQPVNVQKYSEFIQFLANVLENRPETIDVSEFNIPREDCRKIYSYVLNKNPQLFFLRSSYNSTSVNSKLRTISPRYYENYTADDSVEFERASDELLSGIDVNWNDLQKLIYLHDTLVTSVDYDFEFERFNAHDALVEHSAVCQGYSLAFEYLCNRLGIDCELVSSDTIGHMWNAVRLNGKMYYVDCTWDDPIGTKNSSLYHTHVQHNNFLCSQDLLCNNHDSTDWMDTALTPIWGLYNDRTYDDAFFRKANTPIKTIGNEFFYMTGTDNILRAHNFVTEKNREVVQISDQKWSVWNSSGTWKTKYWGLDVSNGSVIISGPTTIYSVTTDGTVKTIYTLSSEETKKGYIYGIKMADDEYVEYWLHRSSSSLDFVETGKALVNIPVPVLRSISMILTGQKFMVGDTTKASYSTSPEMNTNVSWSSSNPAVAKVDSDGNITMLSQGTTTITVIAENGVKDSVDIVVDRIKNGSVSVIYPENGFTYIGSAIKPEIVVRNHKDEVLVKGTDYSVAFANNINAGKGKATVTMKGNYSGSKVIKFDIAQVNINNNGIVMTNLAKSYTGKVLKPTITISWNGKTLKENKDYTITSASGKSFQNKGTYQFRITGTGNFTGTRMVNLVIADKKDISALNPKTTALTNAKISVSSAVYDGKFKTVDNLTMTVKSGKKTLLKGRDYVVLDETYQNNLNAGTATVTILGINTYSGTKKISFKISPSTTNLGNKVIVEDADYCKGGVIPNVSVGDLVKGRDFKVTFKNNTNAGTGNVTVTFTGNYKGTPSVIKTFRIRTKNINGNVYAYANDIVASGKKGKYASAPVLTDTNGKKLKSGTDYTVNGYYLCDSNGTRISKLTSNDIVPADSIISAEIVGKKNYTGTTYVNYRACAKINGISKTKATVVNKEYTGSQINLSGDDIILTLNGKTLRIGTDYIIVSRTENTLKGTASVTVKGIGNYGGIKTISFKINARQLSFS